MQNTLSINIHNIQKIDEIFIIGVLQYQYKEEKSLQIIFGTMTMEFKKI